MPDNFQQTVNLREQAESKRKKTARPAHADKTKAEQLGSVYGGEPENKTSKDLQKISQPSLPRINERLLKRLVFLLAIIIVGATIYGLFFKNSKQSDQSTNQRAWYAVKLINEEIYYGQINDTTADPVVISNVYYNYDQAKDGEEEASQAGNLRLVKRGQETHGPVGVMNIVRAQILYMEPLGENSKVLQAILNYEK